LGKVAQPKLVLIADQMLSMGTTSTEVGLKVKGLDETWNVMVAGDDISLVDRIIIQARRIIRDKDNKYSSANVEAATREAYQAVRRGQIQDIYLSSYGWTIDQFLTQGHQVFPQNHYLSLLYEIERLNLQCQLLVSGFSSRQPDGLNIFEIHNPGVLVPRFPLLGYAAIGSGTSNAIAYLARRDQNMGSSLAETIYNGIAAKHLAEKALGVGKDTVVMIVEPKKEKPTFLGYEQMRAIDKIWTEEADIRPKEIQPRMEAILSTSTS
jgi:hypothetical protein